MKSFRKGVFSLIMAVVLCVGLAGTPRSSNAAIGGVTSIVSGPVGGSIAITGLIVSALGLAYFVGQSNAASNCVGSECGIGNAFSALFIGVPIIFVGLVTLDQSSVGVPEFQVMSTDFAAQARLTRQELESYTRERDELNAVSEAVQSHLLSMASPTAEQAAQVWEEEMGVLSAYTRSAVKKVVAYSANQNRR